jgi:hypothetical protein
MGEGRDSRLAFTQERRGPPATRSAGWVWDGEVVPLQRVPPGLQPGAISIPLRELTGSFLGLTGNETTLRVVPDRSGKTWNR